MIITKRVTALEEQSVMVYLNALRESGVTNMFGATPYIIEEFGIKKNEAKRILLLWMDNFNSDAEYEEVMVK